MDQQITIKLPDDLFQYLTREAKETNQTPEAVATELLQAVLKDLSEDPLLNSAGTLHSDITNISDRHDELIGQALHEELRGQNQ